MPKRCKKCGELGHNSRTCGRKKPTIVAGKKGKRTCKNCGKTGHNTRTCPAIHGERVVVKKKPSNRICSICGEPGHNSRTCLKKSAKDMVVVAEKRTIRTRFNDEDDYLGYLGLDYKIALGNVCKYPILMKIVYYRNYDLFIELTKNSIDKYYLYVRDKQYVDLWIKNDKEYSVSRGEYGQSMSVRSYYSTKLFHDISKRMSKYDSKYKRVYG